MREILLGLMLVACGGDGFDVQAAPTQVGGAAGAGGSGGAVGEDAPGSAGAAGLAEDAGECDPGRRLRFVGEEGAYAQLVPFDFAPPFTIEAWFRLAPGERVDVENHGPEISCGGRLSLSDTEIQATVTASYDVYADVPAGSAWHHVAWTDNGETAKIFLDGQPVAERATGPRFAACTGPMTVGVTSEAGGTPVGWNSGRLDEVRLSSVVRYEGAFTPQTRFETDPHALSLWHFDEDSGNDLISDTGVAGGIIGDVLREICD